MVDPKKMSLAEILAMARAEKNKGADGASTPAPAAPPAEQPAAEPVAAAPEAPAEEAAAEAVPSKPAVKPAAVGKMSIADILAAARASDKGGGKAAAPAAPKAAKPAAEKAAPKPAAKPAAEKPAAAKPAAKATNGDAPGPKDTASILAAARKGAHKPGPVSKSEAAAKGMPVEETAKKKKLEVPPMPAKPAYATPKATPQVDRRGAVATFMAATLAGLDGNFVAGLAMLSVTTVAWVLGFARFMFPNILIEPPTKFKVGFPDEFAPGQVQTKFIPQFGVWVVRYEYEGQAMIYALKSVCTHLGCTPNWLEGEQKFKCPCHGSGFYKDGVNFEGPAPRPLERYAISRADDGQLEVDKSRTFQQELGQWKETASYVSV